jgi:hypothetical protein
MLICMNKLIIWDVKEELARSSGFLEMEENHFYIFKRVFLSFLTVLIHFIKHCHVECLDCLASVSLVNFYQTFILKSTFLFSSVFPPSSCILVGTFVSFQSLGL